MITDFRTVARLPGGPSTEKEILGYFSVVGGELVFWQFGVVGSVEELAMVDGYGRRWLRGAAVSHLGVGEKRRFSRSGLTARCRRVV